MIILSLFLFKRSQVTFFALRASQDKRGSKVIAEHFSKMCIYHENTKAGKHENASSFFFLFCFHRNLYLISLTWQAYMHHLIYYNDDLTTL